MQTHSLVQVENQIELNSTSSAYLLDGAVSDELQHQLVRMFRDPYVLEPAERTELVQQLREASAADPDVSGLRVLLGMALCVNLEAQEALEELREAVSLAPDSFIARLKLGELLMRLRVCGEAADHTHVAAQLATTSVQAELARRQAATLRTMRREGIERGGYHKLVSVFSRAPRWFSRINPRQSAAALTPGD